MKHCIICMICIKGRQNDGNVSNKCSDRSMEVKLSALLGNYDKQTDQPTDRPTNRHTVSKGSFNSNESSNYSILYLSTTN